MTNTQNSNKVRYYGPEPVLPFDGILPFTPLESLDAGLDAMRFREVAHGKLFISLGTREAYRKQTYWGKELAVDVNSCVVTELAPGMRCLVLDDNEPTPVPQARIQQLIQVEHKDRKYKCELRSLGDLLIGAVVSYDPDLAFNPLFIISEGDRLVELTRFHLVEGTILQQHTNTHRTDLVWHWGRVDYRHTRDHVRRIAHANRDNLNGYPTQKD